MNKETIIDCKSEEGLLIGLIDSLMTIATVIRNKDWSYNVDESSLKDAFDDLAQDEDLIWLMNHSKNVEERRIKINSEKDCK